MPTVRDTSHPLARHVPTAEAISLLFRPHVEVVLHDARTAKIYHIVNPYSRRTVGDSSLDIEAVQDDADQSVVGPYRKTNIDGRDLRSITAVLTDEKGERYGLMCINFDVSLLQSISDQIGALAFLPDTQTTSVPMFANWHETVERTIAEAESEYGIAVAAMGKPQLSQLIVRMERQGLLSTRKAPAVVARRLGISRTTLYNYLKAAQADMHEAA